uniref:Uncharacterized protein n=1 Tax=Sorghum bicolor TaxID=4558 RepID=C6JSS3_SORBI
MNAELWVQSPRLLKRKINFLRYNKRVAEGQWAVMDVSVDGILGPPAGSRTTDAAVVANNTTGCRLLPSGCLIEDMGKGNGYSFGVHRWLATLQRQYEYLAVLHSS